MKKIGMSLLVLLLSLTLIACNENKGNQNQEPAVTENGTSVKNEGNSSNDDQEDSTEVGQDNVSNQDDMQTQMKELEYAEFELEVEYADGTEYEAEIEKRKDGTIKAEIEDSLNFVDINGAEAFNKLYPLVKQLGITQQTTKDKAISQTLSIFNLPTDYTKFELELRFNDGTKLEFEDKK
ncbi:hypothetical protein SLU01_27670 [Sporosarcina luteola]|uniref:Lipoprotein n=1 Tax=Sporosarcina luteola TaxID=582850 RepID=A0A511ZAG8_9BACL|nr:YusW family protein [Sporosarcina luteola]GEN84455.1 hypothetical protein SLU01_27670 [Sporosarcina luteola]